MSATTAITFGYTAAELRGVGYPVAATHAITFTAASSGYVPVLRSVASTTAITVGANGTAIDHSPTPYSVSASTPVVWSQSGSLYDAHAWEAAAATGITFSLNAFRHFDYLVSATSEIIVSTSIYPSYDNHIPVSAFTSITVSGLSPHPGTYGPRPVFAASSVTLYQSTALANPGPRPVAAATGITLAYIASFSRFAAWQVFAANVVTLYQSPGTVSGRAVSASSGVVMTSSVTANQAYLATATTGLFLSPSPRTGNLKSVAANSLATLTVVAAASTTGTLVSTSLVFVDLAQAVVWLPWRRSGLSLTPGGNLPHS